MYHFFNFSDWWKHGFRFVEHSVHSLGVNNSPGVLVKQFDNIRSFLLTPPGRTAPFFAHDVLPDLRFKLVNMPTIDIRHVEKEKKHRREEITTTNKINDLSLVMHHFIVFCDNGR